MSYIIKISFIILLLTTAFGCDKTNKNMNSTTAGKPAGTNQSPVFTSGYAPVNGLEMYYEIHGEGMPLVLIHGGGSTIQTTFGRVIDSFARHRKVIAVEMQAHGRTADIDRPLSFEQDADDVAALLTYLKIDSADVFGFSNGGSTALQLGIRHPKQIRKIVAASALCKRNGMFEGFFDFMKDAKIETMPAGLKQAYLDLTHDSAGLVKMFNRDVVRMQNFKDWPDEDIKSIQAPTLVLNSDKDVTTPEHALFIYRLLPKGSLVILPGEHGECIGEITTLKNNNTSYLYSIKIIEDFLDD